MITGTLSLTGFLLARIAEVEDVAHSVPEVDPKSRTAAFTSLQEPTGTVEFSPDQVLAECAAKRRLIEYTEALIVCGEHGEERRPVCRECVTAISVSGYDRQVLGYLSLPYDDHPDWREEWRP